MKIKLPRPTGIAYKCRRDGVTFWMPANSKAHAERLTDAVMDDMRASVKLQRAWTIRPGHVGMGHAGIRDATNPPKRKRKRR